MIAALISNPVFWIGVGAGIMGTSVVCITLVIVAYAVSMNTWFPKDV